MSKMVLIMENWRQYSSVEGLLKEGYKPEQVNVDKVVDVLKKNKSNKKALQSLAIKLMSDPEVKKVALDVADIFKAQTEQEPESGSDELAAAGISGEEELEEVYGKTIDDALAWLSSKGEAALAKVNKKALGLGIIAAAATLYSSGVLDVKDSLEAAMAGGAIATDGPSADVGMALLGIGMEQAAINEKTLGDENEHQ